MTLTIVIVAFNARADLERCLSSLTVVPPAVPHEIIVVDNASIDGAPDMVRASFPHVRLLPAPHNLGFAAANNLAIRATESELILLLNPDTLVPAGALDRLVAELRARPDAAALGPRIEDGTGRAELSFGRHPSPLVEARQKAVGVLYARRAWPVSAWIERRTRQARAVDWVSGACLLVRRPDAMAAGLLDERYFLYWEDVDFCAALRARGRQVWFVPSATITHLRGRSATGMRAATRLAYRRGQVAFYRKHHRRWAMLLSWYLRLRGSHPDMTTA